VQQRQPVIIILIESDSSGMKISSMTELRQTQHVAFEELSIHQISVFIDAAFRALLQI
jgi:hypothetical protein